MANQFSIEPANPLAALMLGVQGYDRAVKNTKEAREEETYKKLGAQISSGGLTNSALGELFALGRGAAPMIAAAGALNKAGTTDEIKEYQYDAKQLAAKGLPVPSFGDWKTNLKKAGATKVEVNQGEKSQDQVIGKGLGESFVATQKAGAGARSTIGSLDVMEKAMADPNFYSGVGAERFVLPIRQGIAAMGGDPKGAASMETFRAQASKAALDSMGGSLGSGFSNADRDFVVNQVPNLQNTPEGNKQLISIMRKIEERKIEIARIAREYAKKNGGRVDMGLEEELTQYAEKNPLFPRNKASINLTAPGTTITGMSVEPAPVRRGNTTSTGVRWSIE